MKNAEINFQDYVDIAPAQSMSDKIYNEFSKLIQDGTLPEGYVFPNEAALCEQLHVGRTSLREAYKALEFSGYVTRTKRGTVVNGKSEIIASRPRAASMAQSSDKDFLEVRCMLEGESAYLAASRATEQDLHEMEEILDQIAAARTREDYTKMAHLDRKFHKALAVSSKNKLIISTMFAMAEVWKRETHHNFWQALEDRTEILDQMNVQHRALIQAIRDRDADEARRLILHHIRYVSHV